VSTIENKEEKKTHPERKFGPFQLLRDQAAFSESKRWILTSLFIYLFILQTHPPLHTAPHTHTHTTHIQTPSSKNTLTQNRTESNPSDHSPAALSFPCSPSFMLFLPSVEARVIHPEGGAEREDTFLICNQPSAWSSNTPCCCCCCWSQAAVMPATACRDSLPDLSNLPHTHTHTHTLSHTHHTPHWCGARSRKSEAEMQSCCSMKLTDCTASGTAWV